MALIKCKECNEQVSTKAKSCPKCGAVVAQKTSGVTWLILFLLIFGVYVINQDAPTRRSTATTSQPIPSSSSAPSVTPPAAPVPPASAWSSTTSSDPLTGAVSGYASSRRVSPGLAMEFPYSDVTASLAVGCDSKSEWVYMGFTTAPNLTNTDTKDGYSTIETRIRWNDDVNRVETVLLTQEWGSNFIHFSNDATIIQSISNADSLRVELEWFGSRPTYFDIPLSGSTSAIETMRTNCSN